MPYFLLRCSIERSMPSRISIRSGSENGALYIGSRMFQILKGDTWIKDTSIVVGPYINKFSFKDGNLYTGWYEMHLWKFDGTKWDSV
jgi:hypothetical protein